MSLAVNAAANTNSTTFSNGAKTVSSDKTSDLTMKDFFNILTAELKYQDPENSSTDSTEYMGQLAEFSILEGVQEVNEALTQSYNLSVASTMIGKKVDYTTTDSAGKKTAKSGTVTAVDYSSTSPECVVGSDTVSLSDIYRIEQAGTTA